MPTAPDHAPKDPVSTEPSAAARVWMLLPWLAFGVAELIPDNIPVAGNLDELLASLLLIRSLLYLGLDPIALKDLAKRQLQKEEEDAELEKNTIVPGPEPKEEEEDTAV